MSTVVTVLQQVTSAAFVVLAIALGVGWLHRREDGKGYVTLSIALLGLISALGEVERFFRLRGPWISLVSLLLFLGSGFAVARMRATYLPTSERIRRWSLWPVVGVAAFSVMAVVLSALDKALSILVTIAGLAVVATWAGLVGAALFRLWRDSGRRPAVQRARLRSLCYGLGGIVLILVVAVVAGPALRNPYGRALIELVALATIPFMYVSLEPPAWLRRHWRAAEEEGLREEMQNLLLASPDPAAVARHGVEWAVRLVGAGGGVILDGELPIAEHGLDRSTVIEILEWARDGNSRPPGSLRHRRLNRTPLITGGFKGVLITVAEPLTVLGSDETARLSDYSAALAAALDRAFLIQRLQATNVELAQASRHKSTFLANMSHELRTPLNAILGFSELLIDDVHGNYDQETRSSFLTQIHESGRHLLSLINDILDLSKVEAGQMEIHPEAVQVDGVVQGALDTIEPLAGAKGILLVLEPGKGGTIFVDRGRLHQILLNLLSNAVKFTPDQGTITVELARRQEQLEIRVTDSGMGIAEKDLGLLFEEFRQVDSAPNRRQQGTGLGLALTKRFVELHGGSINVTSKVGEGSTFTVLLPIAGPETPKPAPARQPAINGGGPDGRPLVVVVEDNEQSANLLVRHLDRGGFRAEVATTGSEALEKVRSLRPLAVTLDIVLPELDGWNILAELKRDETIRDIPVIVVTIVDEPDLGRTLGANDYFVKPVDGKALVAKLDKFALAAQLQEREFDVLVVDDEARERERTSELLREAGFRTRTAAGGKETLAQVAEALPDLILLDLMMPGMTGFDVVAELRENPAARDIPILILSAKDLTEEDKELLNGRVAAIVRKGGSPGTDLLQTLRAIVDQRGTGPWIPA